MNEQIMHMAREAGVRMDYTFDSGTTRWILHPSLIRFAALVAEAERERMTVNSIHSCHPECDRPGCVAVRKAVEAEREACAKVCEIVWDSRAGLESGTAFECVQAIRARGSK
jgi:hypothetical protein